METRVFILSNQILYGEALKSLLREDNEYFDIDVFAVKNPKIKSLIHLKKPDIVLMDTNEMGKSLWKFVNSVTAQEPNPRVIMLANSDEAMYREYALKYGATGYILKSSPKELLAAAIKIVVKGGYFFDPGTDNFGATPNEKGLKNKYNLSSREMQIVQHIKNGFSSKEIANQLSVSFHTIEAHRKNIYNKLGIKKVTELLKVFRNFEA